MTTVIRPTRLLGLICCLAMSACLWRPPIIPPGATLGDGGSIGRAADTGFNFSNDAPSPPAQPDSATMNGEAFDSCNDYSARTDGATPPDGMLQLRDGYFASCPDPDRDAGTSDAATSLVDGSLDARADAN